MAGKNDDNWFARAAAAAEADAVGASRALRHDREKQRKLNADNEAKAALEAFERAARKKEGVTRRKALGVGIGVSGVAAEMAAVASGAAPMYAAPTTMYTMPPTTARKVSGGIVTEGKISAQAGLAAILKEIRNAGDSDAVFKAAGLWLTRATIEIGRITAEAQGDNDD